MPTRDEIERLFREGKIDKLLYEQMLKTAF